MIVSLAHMSFLLTVGVVLCQGFALSPMTFTGRVSRISEELEIVHCFRGRIASFLFGKQNSSPGLKSRVSSSASFGCLKLCVKLLRKCAETLNLRAWMH